MNLDKVQKCGTVLLKAIKSFSDRYGDGKMENIYFSHKAIADLIAFGVDYEHELDIWSQTLLEKISKRFVVKGESINILLHNIKMEIQPGTYPIVFRHQDPDHSLLVNFGTEDEPILEEFGRFNLDDERIEIEHIEYPGK